MSISLPELISHIVKHVWDNTLAGSALHVQSIFQVVLIHYFHTLNIQTLLGTDGKRFLSFDGCHWHSSCFCCTVCSISLVDKGFISEEDHILCSDCALSVDADVAVS